MQFHSFAFSKNTEDSFTQTWSNDEKSVFFTLTLYGSTARVDAEKIQLQFQQSCETAEEFIHLFTNIEKNTLSENDELVALWRKDIVLVVAVKKGKIWLKRGNKVGVLIQSSAEFKIIQGKIQENDVFVLINAQASQKVDEYLSEVLPSASDTELLNTLLMNRVQGYTDLSVAGMIVSSLPDETINTDDTQKLITAPFSSQLETLLHKPAITSITKKIDTRRLIRKTSKLLKFFIVGLSLFALISIIFWGFRKAQLMKTQQVINSYEVRLQEIETQASNDKILARDRSLQLLKEWEIEKETKNFSGASKSLVDTFQAKMQEQYDRLSGRTNYSVLPTFYDFRLVRSDFIATYADLDGNLAQFLDPTKSILIQLNLENKQQLVLPIGNYESLKDLSFSEEKVYLLSNGLYEFQIDSKSDAVKIINEDEKNQNAKYLGVFENFLYVFNPDERNIFRYNVGTEENSSAIGWIQDKKDLDFSNISSMTIDGSIWLGTDTGQVLRYERGEKVEFTPKGLEKELSSPIKIFTKPEFSHIYILEPSQKRVVVLLKDGTYVKEFVHSSLEAGSDIVAREETKSVYVIAGSLLYEMKY